MLAFIIALFGLEQLQLTLTSKALITVVSGFVVFHCWKLSRPFWATIFGFIATIYLPLFTWNASFHDDRSQIPGITNIVVLLTVFLSLFLIKAHKDKNAESLRK
jgi:hypothetical protein